MAEKSYRVEIVVAVIGLLGVLGTAVISNWDKLVASRAISPAVQTDAKTDPSPAPHQNSAPQQSQSNQESASPAQAEQLVSQWIAGMLGKDADQLVKLATVPFYMDNEVLVRLEDIHERYDEFFKNPREQEGMKDWQLKSLKVRTIKELRSEGYDERRDRVLTSLTLADEDFAGICIFGKSGTTNTEGLILFVRRVGTGLKIVGFWD